MLQFGVIHLGRTGAHIVRRLLANGHPCVVYDRSPRIVAELAAERAHGAASVPISSTSSTVSRPDRSSHRDGTSRRSGPGRRRRRIETTGRRRGSLHDDGATAARRRGVSPASNRRAAATLRLRRIRRDVLYAHDLESETKFSFGLGAGIKYFRWDAVGIRAHVRYKPTFMNDKAAA